MKTRSSRPIKSLVEKLESARARHRARHAPSGFGFALADRVDYLPASAWDGLVAAKSVFLSRAYLRALEQNAPPSLSPRYALMFRGETPVAAIAAQVLEISGDQVASKGTRAFAKLRERVLVCGNQLTWGPHGVAFAAGEAPESLWPGVAEALYRLRRAERLLGQTDLVMLKDLPPAELASAAPALRTFSYACVETEPDMVLDLSETSGFDAYLARLNKKYRKAAKEIAASVAAEGFSVERAQGIGAHAEALHRLYLEVHEQAQVRVATFPAGYLPALERALGDGFRCSVIRREHEIAAFATTLRDGDTAIGYYIGFDKALNQRVPLYFRLLQCVVADAIDLGCRRVSFGRTALEPKARLGAKPEPLSVLVRHRVPAFNALLRVLLRGVEFEGPPDRNPFK